MRILEERIANEYAAEEWQPSTRWDLSELSDREVASLIREKNAFEKRNGSYVRYRSVESKDEY